MEKIKLYVASKVIDNNKFNRVFETIEQVQNFIKNNKSWYYDEECYLGFYPLEEIITEAKHLVDKRKELDEKVKALNEEISIFMRSFGNYYDENQYWYNKIDTTHGKEYEVGRIMEINFSTREKLDDHIQAYLQPYEMVIANHVNHSYVLDLTTDQRKKITAWDEPTYEDAVEKKKADRVVAKLEKKKKQKPKEKTCFIYFIREVKSNHIKVGRTINVKTRISSIRTSNPNEIEILKVIKGTQSQEIKIHKKFEQYRVSGEWFTGSYEIVEYIDGLKECEY